MGKLENGKMGKLMGKLENGKMGRCIKLVVG
jgi:hypothetical protein